MSKMTSTTDRGGRLVFGTGSSWPQDLRFFVVDFFSSWLSPFSSLISSDSDGEDDRPPWRVVSHKETVA